MQEHRATRMHTAGGRQASLQQSQSWYLRSDTHANTQARLQLVKDLLTCQPWCEELRKKPAKLGISIRITEKEKQEDVEMG